MNTIVELGKICKFLDSQRIPVTESDRNHGIYPYYGANGIQGWVDDFIFDEPLILLAEDGGHFGSKIKPIAYKITGKSWVNNHAHVIRPKPNCDIDYLHHILSYYDVSRFINGATRPKLTKGNAEQIPIPFPKPDEQKRIAAILDKTDRLRRQRRFAQTLSDSFLQSVFIKMFGDPLSNRNGFDTFELGDFVSSFQGGVNFNPVSESISNEYRVLKISAVTWGEFNSKESKPISRNETFNDTLIVKKGDLLISRANTTELVGAVCMVRENPSKVVLLDKLWRIKFVKKSPLLPDYTLHLLRQNHLRKVIGDLATGSSGSMKNISKEKAKTLPIMLPPPPLQEKFAEIVQKFERVRRQQREATRQAEHLFQTLLHRAFRGGL